MSNKLTVPKNAPKDKAPNKSTKPGTPSKGSSKPNSLNIPKPGY